VEWRIHSLFSAGLLFTALSMFSWVCWIWPKNVMVNQLFGVSSGLGMGILTFDWTQITWAASPLMTPWWAHANVFASFVVTQWILVPIVYYTNVSDLTLRFSPASHNPLFSRGTLRISQSAGVVRSTGLGNLTIHLEFSLLKIRLTPLRMTNIHRCTSPSDLPSYTFLPSPC
jgi:hypothetical protein